MKTATRKASASDLVEAANAAFADGDLAAARQQLAAARSMEPANGQLAMAVGHFKLHAGDLAGALEDYNAAVALESGLATAHASRALTLQLLGRATEAEAAAHQALILRPRDAVALKVLARICLDRGELDEAEAFCQFLLELNPADRDAESLLQLTRGRRLPVQADPGPRPRAGTDSASSFSPPAGSPPQAQPGEGPMMGM